MKKNILLICALLQCTGYAFAADAPSSEMANGHPTYTSVRCWYRLSESHNDVDTDYKWAKNADGSDYQLPGYWGSQLTPESIFYTPIKISDIKKVCENTLELDNPNADILFAAANSRLSLNNMIWTNDPVKPTGNINKMVAFGDSLTDTGNDYNLTDWLMPNRSTWYLGHWTNGYVWAEYIANELKVPFYSWAYGFAGTSTHGYFLPSFSKQVDAFANSMKKARNYTPDNTLFWVLMGVNDFIVWFKPLEQVEVDYAAALDKLVQFGAKNIVIATIPDATMAPVFSIMHPEAVPDIRKEIEAMNVFIKQLVKSYIAKGVNMTLVDAFEDFNEIASHPKDYGLLNTTDPCLEGRDDSRSQYIYHHPVSAECERLGSDTYVWWGLVHPTTKVHEFLARKILEKTHRLSAYQFEKPSTPLSPSHIKLVNE